jgi:transcriptional regulator with XRE-family HTH domain
MVMSTVAAGAYLALLREKNTSYSQVSIAKLLGTSKSQIQRIESGDGETRTSLMLGLARLVGGDPNEVSDLLLDPKADKEQGQRLAFERLERAKAIADQVPDAEVSSALAWVRQLRADPEALRELRQALSDPDELGDAQPH